MLFFFSTHTNTFLCDALPAMFILALLNTRRVCSLFGKWGVTLSYDGPNLPQRFYFEAKGDFG